MRSVRRRPHFVSLMSFSLAWGLLVFMLALPFTVSAANVTYETVRVGPGQYAPSGVQTPITVNVKGPGVSKFHQIVPVANPSTIGKLGRSLIRGGGVGIAVTGVITGLGYLVDQATGEIKKVEIEYGEPSGPYILSDDFVWCSLSQRPSCISEAMAYPYYASGGSSDPQTRQHYGWRCNTGYGVEVFVHARKCF